MKRRAFSIIEVMIAMAIVLSCGAALVINFYESHKERQEKDCVDIIKSKLRMAAQLAKLSDSEVAVCIEEIDGKKVIFLEPDMNVSERMKANLSKQTALPNVTEASEERIAYFPWGLVKEVGLTVKFRSGKEYNVDPSKYAPDIFVTDPNEIQDLFPQKILDDEKEEKAIHVN